MKEFDNMSEILSKEKYIKFFFYGEEYINTEYYNDYMSQRLSDEFGMKYNDKKKCWYSDWNNNQRFVVELYSPKGNHKIIRWGYSSREFNNPEQCLDFQYEIPEYTSDMDYALEYIKGVIDKNITKKGRYLR